MAGAAGLQRHHGREAGEIRLALDALGVQTIRECTLLEARCSLPGITGLEDAYRGRLEDLIYDGQNLGFILQEQTGAEGVPPGLSLDTGV